MTSARQRMSLSCGQARGNERRELERAAAALRKKAEANAPAFFI
jgi:hypothetical protein